MSMPTIADLYSSFTTNHAARNTAADAYAVARGELDEAESDLDTALAALATARANNQNLETPADDVATQTVGHQNKLAAFATAETALVAARAALRTVITSLVTALTSIDN